MMKNYFSKKSKTQIVMMTLLLSSFITYSQTTHNISAPEDLTGLSLSAGDVVVLADGTYTSDERIKFIGIGTSTMPITFRPATPGGVKFTGGLQMSIGGDYLVIDGFHWKGGYGASNFIEFRNSSVYSNHSTIQNCAIDGLALSPDDIADGLEDNAISKHRWIVLYGTYNSVINCSFMNKESAGALILVELEYNASPDSEADPVVNTRCDIVGHTISNNYFYKYSKIDATLSNSGDSETIRVGTSEYQNVNSGTTVSNNYFVEADGENEIITNKSKNNIYTNNTFRRCRGSLVLRHGSNATVDGNYFLGEDVEGTGGIRIVDSNHSITNNYIQDCINVNEQAQWNNGITFLGGGDSADVVCTSTDVSNGYQKVENITLSNNTIINTNAPLYYNIAKGSNDPTGTVDNNLIYFVDGDSSLTDVITGDYTDLGTALAYTGNVYNGTSLGTINTGFSEDTGVTATIDGEIFTFSGATGKGADMGTYTPTTDTMVGYGIGACFLDNLGANITDGTCTIVIGESLTVSSLTALTSVAASYDVSVTANVSWTAESNDDWITIDVNSGTGNETVSVSVTENIDSSSRTGTVTFTQDTGADDIVRILNVSQEAIVIVRTNLINTGLVNDPVTVNSYSSYQVSKEAIPENTLDKNTSTIWTAQDGDLIANDFKGDGEYVIYDLGNEYELDFLQLQTNIKPDSYGVQIWVSTTNTDISDFSMILPTSGDVLLTAAGTAEFNEYVIDTDARYVKLIAFGRFDTSGVTRKSAWSSISEIEFYGDNTSLSVHDVNVEVISVYPVPAKDFITVSKMGQTIKEINLYSIKGEKMKTSYVNTSINELKVDTSILVNGVYILQIVTDTNKTSNKRIVIVR